jgi:hypothetical protein
MSKKTYAAKIDLPGGCHKGRTITGEKVAGKTTYLYSNGEVCLYDCAKEKLFFEEIKPLKYKPGTRLVMATQQTVEICSPNGDRHHKTFKLPAWTAFAVSGERIDRTKLHVIVTVNGRYYLIPETLLFVPEYYWYINSAGQIHQTISGRDPEADKFRKSINNHQPDHKSAYVYLSELVDKMTVPKFQVN